MIDVDQAIRLIQQRLADRIDAAADRAMCEVIDHVEEVRRRMVLPKLVFLHGSRQVLLPTSLKCPECGARLYADIEEWGTVDRRPSGVLVFCETEDLWGDESSLHRGYFSDWFHINVRAERWASKYVRVMR